jgi:hypothetical protein
MYMTSHIRRQQTFSQHRQNLKYHAQTIVYEVHLKTFNAVPGASKEGISGSLKYLHLSSRALQRQRSAAFLTRQSFADVRANQMTVLTLAQKKMAQTFSALYRPPHKHNIVED